MPAQSRAFDAARASVSTMQANGHFANGVSSTRRRHSFPRCRAALDAWLHSQPQHRLAEGEKAERLRAQQAVRKMHMLCNTSPLGSHASKRE